MLLAIQLLLGYWWVSNPITAPQLINSPSVESNAPVEVYPAEDIWKTLLSVKYTYQGNAYIPKFSEKIKALDGKTVTIRGFMYPLDEQLEHEFFMLSYYPINVCFFCGGAGPESVVEINAEKPLRIRSKPVYLRGKLKLNYHDPDRLFYILLGAEIVNE